MSPPPTTSPFASPADAADAVLTHLGVVLGFDLCLFTRTEGDDWLMLRARGSRPGYGPATGDRLRWSDSFCSRMVRGEGPSLVADAMAVPAYAAAPVAGVVQIGAYAGVPVERSDGSLFGTLCAIHPERKADGIEAHEPLVRLCGRLLGTIYEADAAQHETLRRAERAEAEATLDALTGLCNRRGWDLLTDLEDERCRRSGHPACVLSIDLNGLKERNDGFGHAAGDDLLRRAADALRAVVRDQDILARTGGDEFLLCVVECREAEGRELLTRIERQFAAAGVSAAVGLASRAFDQDLASTARLADERMYAQKRRGRGPAEGLRLAA